jgi:GntR family transcriptional regulator, transcriptional repressor for pyruvate dehydrogenase complex
MEGMGLAAQVEARLERVIALGRLPRCGRFGSEQKLAREHGVSRGTVREALRRLEARGLVIQHPGRKTRGVAPGAALSLENLGVALHDEHSQEGLWWLEGFLSLKRQVLVELLSDCCTKLPAEDLELLERACFRLWDVGPWAAGEHCAQLEFELLELAARLANRPGHLLLIQSLQRAFRGNAARLPSLMGGEPMRAWALCARHALGERDVRELQQSLPELLQACDEHVLKRFASVSRGHAALDETRVPTSHLAAPAESLLHTEAPEAPLREEEGCVECLEPPVIEDSSTLGEGPVPQEQPLLLTPCSERAQGSGTMEPDPRAPDAACEREDPPEDPPDGAPGRPDRMPDAPGHLPPVHGPVDAERLARRAPGVQAPDPGAGQGPPPPPLRS